MWNYKYFHINEKYNRIKREETEKIELDQKLNALQKQSYIENVAINLAFKKFERVNRGNESNFIDLTCQSTADARMIVIDQVNQLAHSMKQDTRQYRIICI